MGRMQRPPTLNVGWALSGNHRVFVGCLSGQVFPSGKLEGALEKNFPPIPWPCVLVLRTSHHQESLPAI